MTRVAFPALRTLYAMNIVGPGVDCTAEQAIFNKQAPKTASGSSSSLYCEKVAVVSSGGLSALVKLGLALGLGRVSFSSRKQSVSENSD